MASRSRRQKGRRSKDQNSKLANEQTLAKLDSLANKARKEKEVIIRHSPQKQTLLPKPVFYGLIVIIIVIGGFSGFVLLSGQGGTPVNPDTDTQGGFTAACLDSHSVTANHYHFTLQIFIDNAIQPIPSNVGRISCMHLMHTHSDNNRVHVEPTSEFVNHDPTINDFFEIWQQSNQFATLGNNTLLGKSGIVTATVKGVLMENIWDYIPVEGDTVIIDVITS